MSEYNLKIRNKFINKLVYKINDLNKNLELLQKVDKKIFKNMKGGTESDDKIYNDTLRESNIALEQINQIEPIIKSLQQEIERLRNKKSPTFLKVRSPTPVVKYIQTEDMLNLIKDYESIAAT